MKTFQADLTYRAQFPAENIWAADRILRALEEAQVLGAGRAVREIHITTQHRRVDEFHGGYGRFMPVAMRRRGDADKATIFQLRDRVKASLGRIVTQTAGLMLVYYGLHESNPVGFVAGAAISTSVLVSLVAAEVAARLPREDASR